MGQKEVKAIDLYAHVTSSLAKMHDMPYTQVELLQPFVGDGFLHKIPDAEIGRLLAHPPARLARLLFLREEAGDDAAKKSV
jgi:hypothetical protein